MAESSVIITPYEDTNVYTFSGEKSPIHVIEVPGCKFMDFPVCLATSQDSQLARMVYMKLEFARFIQAAADLVPGFKP